MEINLTLFGVRLQRVLAGEEGTLTLPDSTNLTPLFQNLLTESEIIATTLLGNYEADMARVLIQLIREQFDEDEIPSRYRQLLHLENVKRTDIWELLKDINSFDKTAFTADTYNNNHVKFYFDCHAWVRVSISYDFRMVLGDIIKSVMPPSRVSVIIGEDYQLKKSILRDYLTNTKYFIVLDD
ncbi:hypothetical protein AB3S75_013182 [Citrus x aurantiifolia]